MRHGGVTGFEVKIGQDGRILEPGTGPSYMPQTGVPSGHKPWFCRNKTRHSFERTISSKFLP